jgi:hypothetical protein
MKQRKWTERTLLMLFLFLPAGMKGQTYRMELGLMGGSSFYMGDANANRLFENMHTSCGLLARYNLNGRFALKGNVLLAGISGSTVGEAPAYLDGAEVQFRQNILDAGVQLELGFYEYGVPDYVPGASRVSPYLSFGFGLTGYQSDKTRICANIPFGIGVKAKVLPRINLGCEWSFRKTYADDLDYVSGVSGFQLDNDWAGTGSWNKNKDWYSILNIYISYDLYRIGSSCFK